MGLSGNDGSLMQYTSARLGIRSRMIGAPSPVISLTSESVTSPTSRYVMYAGSASSTNVSRIARQLSSNSESSVAAMDGMGPRLATCICTARALA